MLSPWAPAQSRVVLSNKVIMFSRGLIATFQWTSIFLAARRDPALARSGFLWAQFNYADRDLVLQYTRDAGMGRMLLEDVTWHSQLYGHQPGPNWSAPLLHDWVAQCRAAGTR